MNYYVAKIGNDKNIGDEKSPFLTIGKAAEAALPGDIITVCEGVYRECVAPARGGKSDSLRIVYKAKEGDKVVIKGSEEIKNWEKEGNLWVSKVSNCLFGDYNPFDTEITGDWLNRKCDQPFLHTGAVYLNGEMLKEVLSKDEVEAMCWYAEVDEKTTAIYADFGDKSPNEELTEINVRECCFAPKVSRLDYITVSGFEICHAATNWAPPTAEQTGAVWARWCKGWIIENNIVHHSRCSGISLGRDGSLGHNPTSVLRQKPGFRNQLEIVFKAINSDWSKDNIGSHIVRNNHIYDCGQTGIVGHMGGSFSEIYRNHIHHICKNREFTGAEIAGIKLHAAIDTFIHHNCIHHCYRGVWLDWQAQGVRVSSNVFFENIGCDDLYAEVTHGPLIIDNNILNSPKASKNLEQGSAFINNWVGGDYFLETVNAHPRNTPYHFPHSTAIAGCTAVYQGDERIYNNVFCSAATSCYNEHPASNEEFMSTVKERFTEMTIALYQFKDIPQPVYINNNVYSSEECAYEREENKFISNEMKLEIFEEDDEFYAILSLPETNLDCQVINSHNLPTTMITECTFEGPNGENIKIDTDITGKKYGDVVIPGPIQTIGKKVKIF